MKQMALLMLATTLLSGGLSTTRSAFAQQGAPEDVLARSSSRRISVLQGGAAWCKPALALRMVVEPGSPDSAASPATLIPLMDKLRGPIAARCPVAETALLTLLQNHLVSGRFQADKAHDWSFAAAAVPTNTPLAASLDELPPAPASALIATPSTTQSPISVPATAVPAPVPKSSSPAAPPPPVPAPSAAAITGTILPLDGYGGLMLRLMHDDPSLLEDDGVQRWWASTHDRQAFQSNRSDDFAMHALLQHAIGDMKTQIATHDLSRLLIMNTMQLRDYDFTSHSFPIDGMSVDISLANIACCFNGKLPSRIPVHVAGLDLIRSVPMSDDRAHDLIENRKTRWGSNREVFVEYVIKLDDGAMRLADYQKAYYGRLVGATIYGDKDRKEVLAVIDEALIEQKLQAQRDAARASAQQRVEEQNRQRLAIVTQQRQSYVQMAHGWSPERRIAALLPSSDLYGSSQLDAIRQLRSASVLKGSSVPGILMFQTAASGSDAVTTRWPGKLLVNAASSAGAFERGRWYVAKGQLNAPVGPELKDATFTVTESHACRQDQCTEANDVDALIDGKITTLPSAGGALP